MNNIDSTDQREDSVSSSLIGTLLLGFFAVLLNANTLQIVAETPGLAQSFFSGSTATGLSLQLLGGEILESPTGEPELRVSFILGLVWSGLALAVVAGILVGLRRFDLMKRAFAGLGLPGLWGVLWIIGIVADSQFMMTILQATIVFWIALGGALVLDSVVRAISSTCKVKSLSRKQATIALGFLVGIYVIVFTAMNWGLWFNLRIPHGDSSMYEEHLWNVLHGKGFRSYLDQGLFWGEHIQCIHLLLIPVYWFCPSHLLLEFSESLALAIGAIPIYRMAFRASGSRGAALGLAVAYLVYFPMQFLDIAVDLKTFRPISFGVPIVLFALDQLEQKSYRMAIGLFLLSLLCKEDFAIVLFSVGLSAVFLAQWGAGQEENRKALNRFGIMGLIAGPVYLFLALKAIRWFRSGVEVHYAGYFSKFGESTGEIIMTMVTQPWRVLFELATINSLVYCLALFAPLGFILFRSPLRLLSTLPMIVLLCLNELAQDPRHHFHAPVVPLIFWAAAFSLKSKVTQTETEEVEQGEACDAACRRSTWAASCGVMLACWFSLSPLGVAFWDPGSAWYAGSLYFPDERAKAFPPVLELVPENSRVASTDFVHPRFTHFERSYDYSNYARTVSGGTTNVPEDTQYIVIDTRHPYSEIRDASQIRELQESPEAWELLPDRTNGYFLVLKRNGALAELK